MRRSAMKRVLIYGALSVLVAISAWAATGAATVQVGHNRLEPAEISIAAGDTVTFHNRDEMPGGHTLVADDGSFESPALGKDTSWSHTFAKPGTYAYHIKQHAGAKGRVVVK
jgi:plastocyanin